MNVFLISVVSVIALGIGYFIFQGRRSTRGHAPDLREGKLAACSSKPNCCCTEYPEDSAHFSPPIELTETQMSDALSVATDVIESMGGQLLCKSEGYLAFTFSSSVFRFVDDVEVRLDVDTKCVHLRSASRVGYSDLGVNLKRINAIKSKFAQNIH